MKSLEKSKRRRTIGIYVFFAIGSIIMIFPFVWMFLTSFKTVWNRCSADDAAVTDFYYPAVSDAGKSRIDQYCFRTGISWTGQCIWNVLLKTGLYGNTG